MSSEAKLKAREAFRLHYESSASNWGNNSGPGSDAFYTTDYRAFISKFIRMNSIRTVVDVGCGDWQFSCFIDFGGADYLGLDVVDSVIKKNEARHSSEKIKFAIMPGTLDQVPGGDLLLIKDVLQHLSDEEIFEIRDQLLPKYNFCVLTNSFRKLDTAQNVNIEAGSFRCLDLRSEPYNFNGAYVMEFGSPVWERVRVMLCIPTQSGYKPGVAGLIDSDDLPRI